MRFLEALFHSAVDRDMLDEVVSVFSFGADEEPGRENPEAFEWMVRTALFNSAVTAECDTNDMSCDAMITTIILSSDANVSVTNMNTDVELKTRITRYKKYLMDIRRPISTEDVYKVMGRLAVCNVRCVLYHRDQSVPMMVCNDGDGQDDTLMIWYTNDDDGDVDDYYVYNDGYWDGGRVYGTYQQILRTPNSRSGATRKHDDDHSMVSLLNAARCDPRLLRTIAVRAIDELAKKDAAVAAKLAADAVDRENELKTLETKNAHLDACARRLVEAQDAMRKHNEATIDKIKKAKTEGNRLEKALQVRQEVANAYMLEVGARCRSLREQSARIEYSIEKDTLASFAKRCTLEKEAKLAKREVDDAVRDKRACLKELEVARKELEGVRKELEGTRGELEGMRKDLEGNRGELQGVRKEIEGTCKDLEGMRKEIEGTCKDLEGTRKELEGTRKELEGTRKELKGTRKELEGLRNEIEGTCKDLEGARKELEGTRKELEGTCGALEGTRKELEGVCGELVSANREVDIARGELESAAEAEEMLRQARDTAIRQAMVCGLQLRDVVQYARAMKVGVPLDDVEIRTSECETAKRHLDEVNVAIADMVEARSEACKTLSAMRIDVEEVRSTCRYYTDVRLALIAEAGHMKAQNERMRHSLGL